MYNDIVNTVKEMVDTGFLYFDTALVIKKSPHTSPFYGWAVCVSPSNKVFVMDAEEMWHEVNEDDELMIPTLYQRAKMMSKIPA